MYIIKQFRLTINKLDVGYSKIVTKMLWFTYLNLLLAKQGHYHLCIERRLYIIKERAQDAPAATQIYTGLQAHQAISFSKSINKQCAETLTVHTERQYFNNNFLSFTKRGKFYPYDAANMICVRSCTGLVEPSKGFGQTRILNIDTKRSICIQVLSIQGTQFPCAISM